MKTLKPIAIALTAALGLSICSSATAQYKEGMNAERAMNRETPSREKATREMPTKETYIRERSGSISKVETNSRGTTVTSVNPETKKSETSYQTNSDNHERVVNDAKANGGREMDFRRGGESYLSQQGAQHQREIREQQEKERAENQQMRMQNRSRF